MFTISLAQWSLHRMIFAGRLHPLDFPRFARETFGIDAVEFVSRCFKDHFADDDLSYISELKQRCDDLGAASLLIMVDRQGDLADPDATARAAAVENHLPFLEAAASLGCHSIRVNAGGPSVTNLAENSQPLADCAVDGLRRLGEHAERCEVNVLVENHGGFSSNGAWLAEVIRRVDHPCVGTLPDFGNFCMDWARRDDAAVWYDRYQGVAELMPFARAVSAKSNEFDAAGEEVHTDYARMMRIVLEAGYRGYVGIEYEGADDDEVAGVRATQALLERIASTISF